MKKQVTFLKTTTLYLGLFILMLNLSTQEGFSQVHIDSPNTLLGIGTFAPVESIHVSNGLNVRIETLASSPKISSADNVCFDANGNLIPCTAMGSGDDLGSHVAATALDMSCFPIQNVGDMFFCNGNAIIQPPSGELFTHGQFAVGGPIFSILGNPSLMFQVNGDAEVLGTLFVASDKRYKKNIKSIPNALAVIDQLRGVSYHYDKKSNPERNFSNGKTYGFIAQELAAVIPEVTKTDDNGYYSVNYDAIIPFLTEAIKEQQDIIDDKTAKIDDLENRLAHIETLLKVSSTNIEQPVDATNSQEVLKQNTPNPFSNSTTIQYDLPENTQKANLAFTDLAGKIVMTLPLAMDSKSLTINTTNWTKGTYIYTLIVNGQAVASKKMMVQK